MSERQEQEALVAKKIVSLLEDGLHEMEPATLARLARARQAAVGAMAAQRHAHVTELATAGWGRLTEFSHQGGYRFWLPVLLLLAVVAGIISSSATFRSSPLESTDSLLLASELPPEVYTDKEFVAWLEYTAQP